MHNAVFAEYEAVFPPYARTTWNGIMHRECADEQGNPILRDAYRRDVPPDHHIVVCLHCNQPLELKGD
jgi:Fe2+ or Zn2+ uptake regulation protein